MRFFVVSFLILAAALAPAPAFANITYSGFYCPQRLPCNQADPAFPTTQSIMGAADSCIAQHMGLKSSSNLFDASAGIDESGCLTIDTEAFAATGIQGVIPHCCIESVPNGVCAIHCGLAAQ
ncbi:MAG: hypothetical protein KGI37_11080 [Alphaproteobacteria bacterium]|nr:hypothetical protein [Alphaproteobacteria bacterium]